MEISTADKLKKYAPVVVRIGLALVFLWFSSQQLLHTDQWIRLIPEWATSLSGLSAAALVKFNGIFELIFGTALLLGFFTRIVSGFLALHMLHIMFTVGYGGIGVRDFGLAMATISVFLHGVDARCLDKHLKKH